MAEQTIVIDFNFSSENATAKIEEAKSALAELSEEEKKLREEKEKGNKTNEEYIKELSRIREDTEKQKNTIKAYNDVIKQNVREQSNQKDSLVAMRAELKKATTEFDNLSKAERDGARGKELTAKIQTLTGNISQAEQATGRFQRNVGNYKGSIVGAFSAMGGSAGGMVNPIKNATGAMQAMAKTPLLAILGLIVNIITKVVQSLKTNEEAFNRVKVAMSGFAGVGKIVQKLIDKLANGVAWLAEKLGALLQKVTMAKDELREEQELTKAEIALQKQERQLQVEIAKNDAQVAKLRMEANQKSKLSAKERADLIRQAEELETANFKKQMDLAQKRYDIIKRRNAQTASGSKDIDAENQALAHLYETQTAYYNRIASLTKKEEQLTTQSNKATEAIEAEAEAFFNLQDASRKVAQEFDKLLPKVEQFRDANAIVAEANLKNANEVLRAELEGNMDKYYRYSIESARRFLNSLTIADGESVTEFENRKLKAQLKLKQEEEKYYKWQKDNEKASADERATAYASAFQAMGDVLGQFASESKAMAIAQASMNVAQIIITQGKALAEAIASGAGKVFPANIGAIATGVTAVLTAFGSTIASVKQARDSIAQMATGGLVQGSARDKGKIDSVPAMLTDGEFVVRKAVVDRLGVDFLNRLNGGTSSADGYHYAMGGQVSAGALRGAMNYDGMLNAMLNAVAGIQPVVSVKEIANVSNRVRVKEQIARS